MATFLPRSQVAHQDLPPPDPTMFPMNGGPPRGPNTTFRPQNRASGDYRSKGALAFTDSASPAPVAHQAHLPNGVPRHRATVSGPVFDGPRSPPNTKSTFLPNLKLRITHADQPLQIPRTCPANSSDPANVKQERPVRSPTQPMFQLSTRRANTSPRYARIPCYCQVYL